MKYLTKIKDFIVKFSKKGLSPHEIAAGIALGNFIGCIPVMGTHTIIAIGFAYILRLNTLVVLLGTQISNPLSYPFQLFVSAEIGNLILKGNFLEIKGSREISFLINHYLMPILVGSLALGIVISILSYILVKGFLNRRQRLKQEGI